MSASEYVTGAAWFLVTVGAVGAGAGVVVRRRLTTLRSAELVLGWFVVATAGVMVCALIPLALGVLSRGTWAATALVALLGATRVPAATPASAPAPPPAPGDSRFSRLLAGAALAAAAIVAVAYLREYYLSAFLHVDTVSFHLPNVARWIQSGSLWQADLLVRDQAQGYYPNNGELVQVAAVLPWHDDFLVRWLYVPFMAALALGTYCLGRELSAPRAAAALLAAVPVTLPIVVEGAYEQGMPDSVMYSTWVAGIVFLLRHRRTQRTSDLVLAGAGLGMAFGTKWYGLWAVGIVLVVWAAGELLSRRPSAVLGRRLLALLGLVAAGGGVWLVRNLVEGGDPLYPQPVAPLGIGIFHAPADIYRELAGFTLAHYAGDGGVWRHYLLPAFQHGFGAAWIVVGAAGAAALALACVLWRRRADPFAPPVAAVLLAGGLCAVAYATTPYSAFGGPGHPALAVVNTRYGVPALLLAAGGVAWLAGRAGRLRPVVEVAVALAVADGARRSLDPLSLRDVAAGLVVVLALAGAGLAARRFDLRPRRPGPAVLAGAAAATLVLVAAVGYHVANRFNQGRYRGIDPALAFAGDRAEHRVGLAGYPGLEMPVYPILPSFGPRLENIVSQIAPREDGMLRQYTSQRGFDAALRRGRFDLVVYADGRPPGRHGHEAAWLRAAGWREVARGDGLSLYRPGAR